MQFHKFRFVVTVLVAFSAFYAYMTRLNLSLVIETMAPGGGGGGGGGGEYNITDEFRELEFNRRIQDSLFHSRSEEQTLALLSLADGRRFSGRTANRLPETGRTNNTLKTKHAGELRSSGDQFDAIEFVVDGNKQSVTRPGGGTPKYNITDGTVALTTPATPTTTTTTTTTTTSTAPTTIAADNDTRREDDLIKSPIDDNQLSWNDDQKNKLLGAFFLGYVIFQIPAGRAAEMFGAKALFLVLAIGSGFGSLIFPYAATVNGSSSILWAYVTRFVLGASQAGMFPAVYVILCKWLPRDERSKWLAVPSASGRIGTIAMNLIVPPIKNNYGWPMVFYVNGAMILIWGALFLLLGSDKPATSRWLSQRERMEIESKMESDACSGGQQETASMRKMSSLSFGQQQQQQRQQQQQQQSLKPPPINWLKMLTNRPLLVLTLVMFTSEWSNMLLLVKLAGFLQKALRMEMDQAGMWSSVLVAVYCVHYPFCGYLASLIESKSELSSLQVRKTFEVVAHSVQAFSCVVIAFYDNKYIVIMALILMMVGRSTVGGGQCLMPPELSKDYPGSVMALANSIANVAGVVGPEVITLLVAKPDVYSSWRNLWLVSAAIFAFGGLIFALFADNAPQNYGKKPKWSSNNKSLSKTNLTLGSSTLTLGGVSTMGDKTPQTEDIIRMDSFARVSSEPSAARSRRKV